MSDTPEIADQSGHNHPDTRLYVRSPENRACRLAVCPFAKALRAMIHATTSGETVNSIVLGLLRQDQQ